MANVAKIAQMSLSNARSCLKAKKYGRAFANFLLFLKLKAESSSDVYVEFAHATKAWCQQLEEENRIADLFNCYDQACEMYPHHDVILNNIGAQLFRLGYVEEAAAYIRKSLLVNPNYLAARDNLENVCGLMVERWHFAMLNDKHRNVSYKFAIDKAIKSGYNTVLDIGTGTGILSLMCEFSGALSIVACDGSRAMVDVAQEVLMANGVHDRITLLYKHSTCLQVPHDLPSTVKLVVTETFDAALFGEHIVSTLIHAWKNLISTSPMGTVIPCGATVYVCGIECDTIRSQTRLLYPALQYLDMNDVDLLCSTRRMAEEPYTTENLAKIAGGYTILTNVATLLRVNFNNLCELECLHNGKDWLCDLYVKQYGCLDALAVWFDLHLDDTITITTSADSNSCWEQAIYPVYTIHSQDSKNQVKKKDKIRTIFHFSQDCLRLKTCELLNRKKETKSPVSTNTDKTAAKQGCSNIQRKTIQGSLSVKQCSKHELPFHNRKLNCNALEYSLYTATHLDSTAENKQMQTEVNKNGEQEGVDNPKNDQETAVVCSFFDSTAGEADDDMISDCTSSDFMSSKSNCVSSDCTNDGKHSFARKGSNSEMSIDMQKCSIDSECCGDMHASDGSNVCKGFTAGGGDSEKLVAPSLEIPDQVSCKITCLTDQVDIEYVNDILLNRNYCHILEEFKRQQTDGSLSLLHITPRLSFLAIQACKIGYHNVTVATPIEHHNTIHQVAALNGCKAGDITLMELSNLNDLDFQVDVVISDIVEPCGALRQQVLEDLALHKLTSLNNKGSVVPYQIKIHGIFIESEELENLSHMTGNDKTLGFIIAKYINVFQAQNHLNIDMTTLTFDKLTDVMELLHIDLNNITMNTTKDGLEQTVNISTKVINSGKITALMYWFDLWLSKDTMISTLDSHCHWKQAGIMMKQDITVMAGQTLVTKVMLQNSCLDVTVLKPEYVNGTYS